MANRNDGIMIENYKEYKNKLLKDNKVGIIGMPSGEYIEIKRYEFSELATNKLLNFDHDLHSFIFKDENYYKILKIIKGDLYEKNINDFLKSINVSNYKINDDYSIDVLSSVKIKMQLTSLPVKFDFVLNDFDISFCGLINLKGCPDEIGGDFICTNNNLNSLEHGPVEVGGNYDVRFNKIKKLHGSPKIIKKDFICSDNDILNLIGGPEIVDGSYYAKNCLLTSLDGSPMSVGNNFDCSNNLLLDLKGGPDYINGTYDCSNNRLNSLNGGPYLVNVFKCNGNKGLKNLNNAPANKKIISDEI